MSVIPVNFQPQSTVVQVTSPLPSCKSAGRISTFDLYLTPYAREAIKMAESPVHLLIEVIASEMDANVQQSGCYASRWY